MADLAAGPPEPRQPQLRPDGVRLRRGVGVQLAGPASYFGKRVDKPAIGDPGRPVEPEDIARANRTLYAAGGLALGAGLLARAVLGRRRA